jgi:hypothetical protein
MTPFLPSSESPKVMSVSRIGRSAGSHVAV